MIRSTLLALACSVNVALASDELPPSCGTSDAVDCSNPVCDDLMRKQNHEFFVNAHKQEERAREAGVALHVDPAFFECRPTFREVITIRSKSGKTSSTEEDALSLEDCLDKIIVLRGKNAFALFESKGGGETIDVSCKKIVYPSHAPK